MKKPIPIAITGAAIVLGALLFKTSGPNSTPFAALPAEKSLRSSSQFILLEDFNSGKFTERKGATWRTKAVADGALEVKIDKVDGRSESRGYSLKASFNLLKNEKASFHSFLNQMDASSAESLVFKTKISMEKNKAFKGKLEVELTDWKHRKYLQDITDQATKQLDAWSDIVAPMEKFDGIDADQVFSIRFILTAPEDSNIKGNLWVDELAFFGEGDISFKSHRDNLVGFPEEELDERKRKALLSEKDDKEFLKKIAEDTWRYFQEATDKDTGLVVDHIRVGENALAADYTSLTNIAMDLMGTIGAMDMGFISEVDARAKVSKIMDTLAKMSRYKGFFYNFYNTKNLQVTRDYISAVDSGWLAVALVVVRQTFDGEIASQATHFLDAFDFDLFIDPENNQMVIGFEVPLKEFGKYHYGMLATEIRATSLYAIGKGDVSRDHWWFLYRTPPKVWKWQNQTPKGKRVTSKSGMDYFQGYYEKDGKKFVPSWGGSLFEYLMPTLVLKERELAPKGLGANNIAVSELHRDYALKEKGYPVWGISPASQTNGRGWQYSEFGVKSLAVKGYPDRKVITPHVGFLALDSIPESAISNARALLEFPIYGEYGYYDSISLRDNTVNPQYLALDQGMILVAIANYLQGGSIQERFHQDPVGQAAQDLLSEEDFFNS